MLNISRKMNFDLWVIRGCSIIYTCAVFVCDHHQRVHSEKFDYLQNRINRFVLWWSYFCLDILLLKISIYSLYYEWELDKTILSWIRTALAGTFPLFPKFGLDLPEVMVSMNRNLIVIKVQPLQKEDTENQCSRLENSVF